MKTPQIPAMPGMSPLGIKNPLHSPKCLCDTCVPLLRNRLATDQKTVAERQWQKAKLAPAPQKPCDHGLFSDEANQLDLLQIKPTEK
jgi:hypothetical protein